MNLSTAYFCGGFNPPTGAHRRIAASLAERFGTVVVAPSGPVCGEVVANDVEPIYRAAMADLNFRGLERVVVDLSDLEAACKTPPAELLARAENTTPWLVVGREHIAQGGEGRSAIQTTWADGARLWREARFAVVVGPEKPIDAADLPPNHEVIVAEELRSGATLRSHLLYGRPVADLLLPEVAEYIVRHGLYRGVPPTRRSRLHAAESRLLVIADERNEEAVQIAKQFSSTNDDPELIVVVGGDGTMLRAIREHWRRRVPFYGINAGHLGFLLNDVPASSLADEEFLLEHVPLLHVETEDPDGVKQASLAFNDTWVERASGQTAWIEVLVNGQQRLSRLVADGALIATAAGSTSYARAMGATPLPLGTSALMLVGSNVLAPDGWRPVVLPLETTIELRTLDTDKRPLRAFVDGRSHGAVRWLRARMSNIAAAELAFSPGHDPVAKLSRIQFPQR
jgi:NAD+ kinase